MSVRKLAQNWVVVDSLLVVGAVGGVLVTFVVAITLPHLWVSSWHEAHTCSVTDVRYTDVQPCTACTDEYGQHDVSMTSMVGV